jgi:hypothetical protein
MPYNIPTNLNQVDITRSSKSTDGYFSNYFDKIVDISGAENDAIISYFEYYTKGNKKAALALASAVMYTAQKIGSEPMGVLDEFKKVPIGNLSTYLCMYLNLNRVGTSLLGTDQARVRNQYVERNILP